MSAPEDNPADDVQPTKEEYEEYERKVNSVLSGFLFPPDGIIAAACAAANPLYDNSTIDVSKIPELNYFQRASMFKPVCRHCGKPATCYGTYEKDTGYACDECCGNGSEDGVCNPIKEGQ